MAALLRKTIIFDNFVLYKSIESPDNYEVIFAKALGRGKASGETISWEKQSSARYFPLEKLLYKNSTLSKFLNRSDHPFVIGFPIEITPDIFYTLMIIRFGGPSFTDEDKSMIELFTHHIKMILQKKSLLDKIANLEAEHEHIAIQDDFISTISHELLSPIGFIKGYTTTLMRSDTT